MLTISTGCACDVCAEEYGPKRQPHSIPCGHVLCSPCITSIIEKTSPRLSPSCPFCRENFTQATARIIRMDFSSSSSSTSTRRSQPQQPAPQHPAMMLMGDAQSAQLLTGAWAAMSGRSGVGVPASSAARAEVRRFEERIATVAAKKSSVEDVYKLYQDLDEWLRSEREDQHTPSLILSTALLRAILLNHRAQSDATLLAKQTEDRLKGKISDLEDSNFKYEAENRRQRSQMSQKSLDCTHLQSQIIQLRDLITSLGGTVPEPPPMPTTSPTPSPAPYANNNTSPTPLSRFANLHQRSASMSVSSRPTTPMAPLSSASSGASNLSRSHTPAPPSTSTPPRSHTPAPSRSHTPGPGVSSASAAAASLARSHTPAPHSSRSQTPALRHTSGHVHRDSSVPPVPVLPTRFGTPAPSTLGSSVYATNAMSTHITRGQTPSPHHHAQAPTTLHSSLSNPTPSHTPPRLTPTPTGNGTTTSTPIYSHTTHTGYPAQVYVASNSTGTSTGTGAPPLVPPKPRRLSQPSPPKMGIYLPPTSTTTHNNAYAHIPSANPLTRSTSEEKAEAREKWLHPSLPIIPQHQPQGDDDYVFGAASRGHHPSLSYGGNQAQSTYGYGGQAQTQTQQQQTKLGSGLSRSMSVRPPSRQGGGFASRFGLG